MQGLEVQGPEVQGLEVQGPKLQARGAWNAGLPVHRHSGVYPIQQQSDGLTGR